MTPTTDPCALLQLAQQQLYLLLTGQAVVAVETPQLGRVEYYANSKSSVADLQRLVDGLTAQCAAASGTNPCGSSGRRKPFSFEAWP